MFKKHLPSLIISVLFTTAPAFATDTGTITFTGRIVPDTCEVDINGSTTDATVTFRNLSKTSFGSDQKVGDRQPFTITVRNCDVNVSKLNVTFVGATVSNYNNEVLAMSSGSATNVGIRISPENTSTFIAFDGTEATTEKVHAQDTDVVFNYTAEVIQVGDTAPTAGDYTANATYTLVYR